MSEKIHTDSRNGNLIWEAFESGGVSTYAGQGQPSIGGPTAACRANDVAVFDILIDLPTIPNGESADFSGLYPGHTFGVPGAQTSGVRVLRWRDSARKNGSKFLITDLIVSGGQIGGAFGRGFLFNAAGGTFDMEIGVNAGGTTFGSLAWQGTNLPLPVAASARFLARGTLSLANAVLGDGGTGDTGLSLRIINDSGVEMTSSGATLLVQVFGRYVP